MAVLVIRGDADVDEFSVGDPPFHRKSREPGWKSISLDRRCTLGQFFQHSTTKQVDASVDIARGLPMPLVLLILFRRPATLAGGGSAVLLAAPDLPLMPLMRLILP